MKDICPIQPIEDTSHDGVIELAELLKDLLDHPSMKKYQAFLDHPLYPAWFADLPITHDLRQIWLYMGQDYGPTTAPEWMLDINKLDAFARAYRSLCRQKLETPEKFV